ncbi:hypothetical protein Sjap_008541 [Stephania japonica]|uniref:Uncharacterized protein n=1 Tax=Stephania japonica TaxID=461633 RepID=A0AAP0PBG1_9MAGN
MGWQWWWSRRWVGSGGGCKRRMAAKWGGVWRGGAWWKWSMAMTTRGVAEGVVERRKEVGFECTVELEDGERVELGGDAGIEG